MSIPFQRGELRVTRTENAMRRFEGPYLITPLWLLRLEGFEPPTLGRRYIPHSTTQEFPEEYYPTLDGNAHSRSRAFNVISTAISTSNFGADSSQNTPVN
jgi:hypothetical protein